MNCSKAENLNNTYLKKKALKIFYKQLFYEISRLNNYHKKEIR